MSFGDGDVQDGPTRLSAPVYLPAVTSAEVVGEGTIGTSDTAVVVTVDLLPPTEALVFPMEFRV